MNQIFECPHCGVIMAFPEDDYFEGFCESCSTDYYAVQEPDQDEESVGDIAEDSNGLAILTPHGWWRLTDEEVLSLNSGLGQMIQHRLTAPWSDDDQSTIITRGRRTYVEEGK